MKTAIEFRNIKKSYGEKTVLEDFSLSVQAGEFVTMIGSSGCGKTTVLKMVNGLVTPTAGEVYVNGENIGDKDMIQLRRSIGYAIQGSVLFPHMTVEKNISYVPNLLNRNDRKKTKQAVKKWMEIVGLERELRSRYPSELSGGQQQRVGIARAFAAHPEVVFADEPTGNLDTRTTKEIMAMMLEIARKHRQTLVLVTHDPEMAGYADRIVKLIDGEIVDDHKVRRTDKKEQIHRRTEEEQ